jgi:hypothetical protein
MVPVAEAGRVHDADVPGLAASVRPAAPGSRTGGTGQITGRQTRGCGGQGPPYPRIKSRGSGLATARDRRTGPAWAGPR